MQPLRRSIIQTDLWTPIGYRYGERGDLVAQCPVCLTVVLVHDSPQQHHGNPVAMGTGRSGNWQCKSQSLNCDAWSRLLGEASVVLWAVPCPETYHKQGMDFYVGCSVGTKERFSTRVITFKILMKGRRPSRTTCTYVPGAVPAPAFTHTHKLGYPMEEVASRLATNYKGPYIVLWAISNS